MPLFKRKPKTPKLSPNEIIEQRFLADIQAAELIEKPVSKILSLQEIRYSISDQLHRESKAISKKADRSEKTINAVGDLSFWAGIITAGAVTTGPVGLIAGAAGCVVYGGATLIGSARAKAVKKKLEQKSFSHKEKMEGLYALAGQMIDTTLDQEKAAALAKAASASKAKELSDEFSPAAGKQAAPPAEDKKKDVILVTRPSNSSKAKLKPRLEP